MIPLIVTTLLLTSLAFGQESDRYQLRLTIAGEAVTWQPEAPARRDGELLLVPAGSSRATVRFPGGWLDLEVDDLGVWDRAHVLAVAIRPAAGGLVFDATVRHRDEGWEHYAHVWRVRGEEVTNGVRELLHPHDSEQPFTRSQTGVVAAGTVTVEAADTVHGYGGSTVMLDLDALTVPFELAYQIQPLSE